MTAHEVLSRHDKAHLRAYFAGASAHAAGFPREIRRQGAPEEWKACWFAGWDRAAEMKAEADALRASMTPEQWERHVFRGFGGSPR